MVDERLPQGMRLIPEFCSPEREAELIYWIDAQDWRHDLKRRVQHYGWRYDYRARGVSPEDDLGPLPRELAVLLDLSPLKGAFCSAPDQIIVNEYLPGQGISAHIDCEPCFGPVIASLSLGCAVDMVFRHCETKSHCTMRLQQRSLLILSGEARYKWTHEIPARKSDAVSGVRIPRSRRISLTFRTVISQ